MSAEITQAPPPKIETLQALADAAANRKAVHCPHSVSFRKPRPAQFVLNCSGSILLGMFRSGMFIYTSKKKQLSI